MEIAAVSNTLATALENAYEGAVYYGGRLWSYALHQTVLFANWVQATACNLWHIGVPYAAYALELVKERALMAQAFIYLNPVPCAIALACIITLGYVLCRIN